MVSLLGRLCGTMVPRVAGDHIRSDAERPAATTNVLPMRDACVRTLHLAHPVAARCLSARSPSRIRSSQSVCSTVSHLLRASVASAGRTRMSPEPSSSRGPATLPHNRSSPPTPPAQRSSVRRRSPRPCADDDRCVAVVKRTVQRNQELDIHHCPVAVPATVAHQPTSERRTEATGHCPVPRPTVGLERRDVALIRQRRERLLLVWQHHMDGLQADQAGRVAVRLLELLAPQPMTPAWTQLPETITVR